MPTEPKGKSLKCEIQVPGANQLLVESPRRGDFERLGKPSLPPIELAPSKADLRPQVFFNRPMADGWGRAKQTGGTALPFQPGGRKKLTHSIYRWGQGKRQAHKSPQSLVTLGSVVVPTAPAGVSPTESGSLSFSPSNEHTTHFTNDSGKSRQGRKNDWEGLMTGKEHCLSSLTGLFPEGRSGAPSNELLSYCRSSIPKGLDHSAQGWPDSRAYLGWQQFSNKSPQGFNINALRHEC
jgi:hypothetical protein